MRKNVDIGSEEEKKKPEIGKFKWKWQKEDTLIYGYSEAPASNLIVGLDMDDTIIITKSGAKFAKSVTDWVWWDEKVPVKLKEYAQKGYKIVIFTNQKGISTGKTHEKDITGKIEKLAETLDIKLSALIATDDDSFRKPMINMWKWFTEKMNENKEIDKKASFFVGDAAGRKTPQHKDFSDTDIKFALNIGLPFQTPEEFFLGEKEETKKANIGFDPKSLPKTGSVFEDGGTIELNNKEMIIFVGSPASGKSTFWKTNLSSKYERVNRDTLKTKEKCLKKAKELIQENKSLVIDNTCPKKEDRRPYIDLAKENGYQVRCFWFKVEKDLCFHLDKQRSVNEHRKHMSGKVGPIPVHGFFKNMEPPNVSEGFKEIKVVKFIAGPFESKEDEEQFFSFVK